MGLCGIYHFSGSMWYIPFLWFYVVYTIFLALCGIYHFSGSMWYILFLSTYSVSFWPLEVGYGSTRVSVSGWIEYCGGQCVFDFCNLSGVNQWFQYNGRVGVPVLLRVPQFEKPLSGP